MKRMRTRSCQEKGAVLLTVLLMLAAMSAIAVKAMDEIRFDIRRAVNTRLQDQAFWFALGGEVFARTMIERAERLTPGRTTMAAPWTKGPIQLPLDTGLIEASIEDGGNCFNLNSVVVADEGVFEQRERGIEQYIELLEALGIGGGDRQTLAYSLADWIDTNGIPGPRGAEDYYYSNLMPPYRTSGTLLADVTELRAINGYTEDIYRAVRPFVCALPTDELSQINVNTLREEEAPLLTMLLGRDRLNVDRARGLIARRPFEGYSGVEEFWADEALTRITPDEDLLSRVSLQTRFFDVRLSVTLEEAFFAMNSQFERQGSGMLRLVSRSYGFPE